MRRNLYVLGMELAGMVALGEYSDGCICEVAGKHASSVGAAGAAAAAVMVDMANRSQQASDVAPPPVPATPITLDRAASSLLVQSGGPSCSAGDGGQQLVP